VLHTESSPGLGGQEIRTLDEARWISESGWRVVLACQAGGRLQARAAEAGLEAVAVRMRGAWDVGALRRLVRLIGRQSISIVHTHSSVDGWLGGMAARLAGVPVVRTRHVSIPIRRGWNPVYAQLADRVVTSGEAIRALVIGAGVPADRVVAIPAGVRLEDFTIPAGVRLEDFTNSAAGAADDFNANGRPAGAEAVAKELRLRRPVIGSVAMFRGSKGHAHLLDAFAVVRRAFPDARLLLVGDGIRRQWVEELARDKGLGEAVVFTGFRADVPALLATMDCFALASTRTEGVPQSLLQAFAAGVPVVASSIGGIPEIVEDGVTGLLVPPEDPAALATAIQAVLGQPAAAAERAAAARRLVEARFSHRAAVGRLLALYEELLSGGPSVAGVSGRA
jgi:glycosyltransferase involved in cell wall biosynthesis